MTTSMPPCHSALASFDGTTAYSNGPYTGTGSSCGGSAASGLRYQCPEVVMRHFMAKWGFRWWGNAKDLLANAPKDKTDVYYNGDVAHPPVPGDALIWTKGAYGHVALISAVTSTSVSIIEQNWAGSGKATFAYANGMIASRGNGWVPAGWVHARVNTGKAGPAPQPPAPSPPSPPSGINWSCSKSSYQGQQLWTCSAGTLYKCVNGTPVKKDCPGGCNQSPLGTDDSCKSAAPPPPPPSGINWSCNKSSYQGQQLWTCSTGTLYKCVNSAPVKKDCPNGCNYNPLGTDDTCMGAAPPPINWSCNKSSYQGQQLWTCSAGTLYKCVNSAPVKKDCPGGCDYNPLGTDDACK